MSGPVVLRTIAEMKAWRSARPGIAFVPTMGALHEGHATLLRHGRRAARHLVLSIFVNPAQFGPREDLSRYPRTFESDLELAGREGVDAVFFPTPAEIYPPGYSTYVEETRISSHLCGAFRPGHFRGVTTVVLKLFEVVRPEVALFGLKDAQQFFVLEKMARELNLDLRVEAVATVREVSGLARSSRNVYLSDAARARAAIIPQILADCESELRHAAGSTEALGRAKRRLGEAGLEVQYLELWEVPEFAEVAGALRPEAAYLLAVAAYLEGTRLIDNRVWGAAALRGRGTVIHVS